MGRRGLIFNHTQLLMADVEALNVILASVVEWKDGECY